MADIAQPQALLTRLFQCAVAAADPLVVVPPHLPPPPKGRSIVIGAGKAAAAMARAVEDRWQGPLEGLVVTRYGHGVPCRRIQVVEAGHPMPDAAGREAAARILALVNGLSADDLVLCLMSGGGSALLVEPAPGITLADKQAVTKALLASGATISEINTVRKHLSAIKGGRLAERAQPARLVTLAISDVPGDDPAVIASGPTVPDSSTLADARDVLARHGIVAPPAIAARLGDSWAETPKPGHPSFARTVFRQIASPQQALEAAAALARETGIPPLILSDRIEGEAREVAKVHAAIARQIARFGQPAAAPCVILSGGETTVTVRGKGRGGRNAEFLLGLALALDGAPGVHALAADTDGIDGSEDNAGARLGPDSLARASALGLDGRRLLANNDAYSFFAGLGDLVVTGPTRTNVNDFRAILIVPTAA
ncbi:MAG: glycerate kinase [Alphaproteobacteria bacterium]|nr:glycerate kinase [Alphaproteobacteria bacterium]